MEYHVACGVIKLKEMKVMMGDAGKPWYNEICIIHHLYIILILNTKINEQ